MPSPTLPPITLLGFPFNDTGRGEHIRAIWRALGAAGVMARIHNVGGRAASDDTMLSHELGPFLIDTVPAGIRLFHLNGSEIPTFAPPLSMRRTGDFAPRSIFASGYNIVFPAWELPHYPAPWARDLERFDEVWAPSAFVYDSIRSAVNTRVFHIPCACEPHLSAFLDRSHFGIPTS